MIIVTRKGGTMCSRNNNLKSLLILIASLLLINSQTYALSQTLNSKHIILIRHAEKSLNGGLNNLGKKRAKKLSYILRNSNISKIYSTDYLRTIQTVTPLSKRYSLPIIKYDSIDDIIDYIKIDMAVDDNKSILVVGHSNTIPELIYRLGGPSLEEIPEEQFDNLFILLNTMKKTGFLHLNY
jgi:2,3-bisphosphoglycerate-dependent phosphoglycerate mutase